ncbi:MAG: hypothetical protein DDT37_01272 [Firmicutes bacterium]|nr:hypothetical protein [candidate division NPL-UPA2 bacterium]MBT9153519.1 hypothetical protein [candidate division NPL-UPA2 bacterium]MBT9156287.1 hypothetical protein [candidate division NPL-UPA2 bacterium]
MAKGLAEKAIGGQAVMEGVLMRRASGAQAIAVRRPDGTCSVKQQRAAPLASRYVVFRLPIVRGAVALVDTLTVGIDALLYSANESGGEEAELSKSAVGVAVFLGLALAVGLFMLLPTVLLRLFGLTDALPLVANLLEGVIRLSIFTIYIAAISYMPDMRRFFQYHGAEHKAINCYEAGHALTIENVRRASRFHTRCGTSFLLVVMLTSVVVFAFFGWPNVWVRIITRLLLLPLVAGLAYEVIKFSARGKGTWQRVLTAPGMVLQRATTREPDDSQIEVAITALRAICPDNNPGEVYRC